MPDLFLQLQDEHSRSGFTPAPLLEDEAVCLLRDSEFTASKLIPWGSNYSFAVALEAPDGREQLAIYKPRDGEAPLYDFPEGTLYLREVAAYRLSKLLGWDIVPPTIIRNGPHGVGSVQLYIAPMQESADWDPHRFWGECSLEIERIVLFDQIANNADRKLGHCLRDASGKVWGIDHGLTFNHVPKLRTVLWQFVDTPIHDQLLDDLELLLDNRGQIRNELRECLSMPELVALEQRIERLVHFRSYPKLNPRRNVPYGWW